MLREALPALLEFKDTMMGLMTKKQGGGSDDESAGAKSGGEILRTLRRAHRTYERSTPSPLGKANGPKPSSKNMGETSRTKTASRDLNVSELETEPSLDGTGSESSTKMKALLDHFASDTSHPSPATAQQIPKKETPVKHLLPPWIR